MIRNVVNMNKVSRMMQRIVREQKREIKNKRRVAVRQIADLLDCNPSEVMLEGLTLDELYAQVGDLRFYLDGRITKHYLIYTCCPVCERQCRLIRPPRLPERDLCTVAETIALQEAVHAQPDLA